jgi:hypothetical protein
MLSLFPVPSQDGLGWTVTLDSTPADHIDTLLPNNWARLL